VLFGRSKSDTPFSPPGLRFLTVNVSIFVSTSGWGGAQLHTVELSRTLVARAHTVKIVELGRDGYAKSLEKYIDCVEFLPLRRPTALQTMGWIEACRLVYKLPRDVCVLVKSNFETGNWKLDLTARLWFRRFIVIEHTEPPLMPPRTSRRYFGGFVRGVGLWWVRQFIPRWARSVGPHLLVTVSEAVRRRLIDVYRFPGRKIVTVYGGIDTTKFTPNIEFRRSWRAAWGIGEDSLVFGAVGRLHEAKGYSLAIELFASLVSRMPNRDMRLVFVGEGPLEAKLKAAAAKSGFGDRIIFENFTYEPWRVYPAFDLFVMPSTTEALGLALLEAMACGCPPIAMGVGGILEVITDPNTGWLVPEEDREGFFAALISAAQSTPKRLAEMGQRARERVVANFDAKPVFARLADLIEFGAHGQSSVSCSRIDKMVGVRR
jgi:glycosyltransferase involved in cell wall biosynthesis